MSLIDSLKARLGEVTGSPGLIYKSDPRDLLDEQFGLSFGGYTPRHEKLSYYRYDYNQSPNNTCTQCAVGLALSEQMSVRWSIDAITKMLVKEGRISGNGFCSQQPPMGAAVKHGLIPYDLLPDVEHQNWNELRRMDAKTAHAYAETANKYKMTSYRRLRNEEAVIEALDAGYVPIVASKWHSAMNNPFAPKFYLRFQGYIIGGHQYRITGYRYSGADFENGQTFGRHYGDNGKSFNETLFGSGYYEVWIMDYNGSPLLPTEDLLPLFLKQHEGLLVKAHDHENDPRCYIIEDGQKRHVLGEDNMKTFFHLQSKLGLTKVNRTLLQAVPSSENYPFI